MRYTIKDTLLLLLTICTGNLFAQMKGQAHIDSLIKELPHQKEDTNKVKLLYDVSFEYQNVAPGEVLNYAQQSLDLALKLDWKIGIAPAYRSMGVSYMRSSDYPKALEYYFKSLKQAEEIGDKKNIAAATINIGNTYLLQSDGVKGLEYHTKALKLAEEMGNTMYIAICFGNIGYGYEIRKDYPKALENYTKALKLSEEIGDFGRAATHTGSIAEVYRKQRNYQMAVEYSQRAIKGNEETGNKHGTAQCLLSIGELFITLVIDTPAKTSILPQALEPVKGNYQPSVSIHKGKADQLRLAIDYVQRALKISKEIEGYDLMLLCYRNLSRAYKLKGSYKTAMEYGDSATIIKDSVFSQENREKIAKLENARRQYGDSLTSLDVKKAAGVKAVHRRNYELIGGGVFVFALGFIFVVTRKNRLLDKEKKQSENLLLNILPEEVATQLKQTGAAAARQFDDVTVLFTDFVNFTESSERMRPDVLLEELNICFKAFDEITSNYGIEKIKTIGDAYLAVGGLPTADPKHAENTVRAAIEINNFMQDRLAKLGERTFAIRIGIHSGSVVAGIVGVKKFAYDIWGDTVNTAARMEQNSEAGKINISATTYELVKNKFKFECRGEVDVKGKGVMKMYYVS